MYFSIFEKTSQSTLGKNLLGITVVDLDNKSQSFTLLMFRSFVSLMNFVSLGLFSYFDLQNKVSNSFEMSFCVLKSPPAALITFF